MKTVGKIIGWTAFVLLSAYLVLINPVSQWELANRLGFAILAATGFLAWFISGLLKEQRELIEKLQYKVELIFTMQVADKDEHNAGGAPSGEAFYKAFTTKIAPTVGMYIYDDKLEYSFKVDRVSIHLDDDTLYLHSNHIADTREHLNRLTEELKGAEWLDY